MRRRISNLVMRFARRAVDEALDERLWQHTVAGPPERLHVHPRARLNDALINTQSGDVTIEAEAFFGHQVMILTGRHDIEQFGAARRDATPKDGYDVVIESGAWVASRAIVIGPCTIGEHAVVAAGSVVTSSVPPYAIVAGVPARQVGTIRSRPTE